MNEIGLDPGIDHMSAIETLMRIRDKGGSCLGLLVAPESDTNLWNYKFTWAPRNVVLAGQEEVQLNLHSRRHINTFPIVIYLEEQSFWMWKIMVVLKHILSRDSLKYRSVYGLDNAACYIERTIER
jgi:hypothetical protein